MTKRIKRWPWWFWTGGAVFVIKAIQSFAAGRTEEGATWLLGFGVFGPLITWLYVAWHNREVARLQKKNREEWERVHPGEPFPGNKK